MQLIFFLIFFSTSSIRDGQSNVAFSIPWSKSAPSRPPPCSQTTPEHPASIRLWECVCTGSPLFLDPGGKPCWRHKLALLYLYYKDVILVFNMSKKPLCKSECSRCADEYLLVDRAMSLTGGGVLAYRDLGVVCWKHCLHRHVVEEAVSVPRKQIY